MTDKASITFTGKVSRVHRFDNGGQVITVESDLGGKYPSRSTLKGDKMDDLQVSEGDTVEVTSGYLPRAGKPWQNGDGEWKPGGVEYWNPRVSVTSERDAIDAPAPDDDEIPF